MPDPAPTLQYATPVRRPPLYLVIILSSWAIFDLLAGLFLTLEGFFLFSRGLAVIPLFGCFFLLLGALLFFWSFPTSQLANRILHAQPGALHHAARLTAYAEIATWLLVPIPFVIIFTLPNFPHVLFLLLFPVFPLAVTATRLLLRNAARRLPPFVNSSTR